MSGTLIIATAASTFAAQQAAIRKTNECLKLEASYDSTQQHTVQEARSYANCILHLHPDAATGTEVILLKILVATTIIAVMVGTALGAMRDKHMRLLGAIMGGLFGLITPTIIAMIIFGLLSAVQFLGS